MAVVFQLWQGAGAFHLWQGEGTIIVGEDK